MHRIACLLLVMYDPCIACVLLPEEAGAVRSMHRVRVAPRRGWCCTVHASACVLLPEEAGDARPMHHVLTRPFSMLTDKKLAPCGRHTRSARDAAAEHWDTGSHRVSQSEQKQVDGAAREHRWAQVATKTRSFLQPTHSPSVSMTMQQSLPLLQSPHARAVCDHLFPNQVLLAPSSTCTVQRYDSNHSDVLYRSWQGHADVLHCAHHCDLLSTPICYLQQTNKHILFVPARVYTTIYPLYTELTRVSYCSSVMAAAMHPIDILS
jgi:hypothetical protein